MQDVPSALARKGLTYACYMDPSKPALLDEAHSVRLNYESYLFADTAARELFLGDVLRFCGLVTDPVSKRRFRPTEASPVFLDRETDVDYYFETSQTHALFIGSPADYRLPGYRMK